MPHSVKCIGRVPRTMHNFLRGHIGDGGALKYGGDNLSLYQRDPLYDLEAQRVSIWPIPGGPNDNISLGVTVVAAEGCGAGCGGFGRKASVPGGRRGTPVVGGVGPCEDCGNAHRKRDGCFQ